MFKMRDNRLQAFQDLGATFISRRSWQTIRPCDGKSILTLWDDNFHRGIGACNVNFNHMRHLSPGDLVGIVTIWRADRDGRSRGPSRVLSSQASEVLWSIQQIYSSGVVGERPVVYVKPTEEPSAPSA